MLCVVGACLCVAAIAHNNWRGSRARVAGIANGISDSYGWAATSAAPATWPTVALGVLAGLALVGGAALWVAAHVRSDA